MKGPFARVCTDGAINARFEENSLQRCEPHLIDSCEHGTESWDSIGGGLFS